MNPEIKRAEEAKRVLAEPLLIEAFEGLELAVIEQMRRVDVGDADRQRDLIVTLQAARKVQRYLADIVTTGKMVELSDTAKRY